MRKGNLFCKNRMLFLGIQKDYPITKQDKLYVSSLTSKIDAFDDDLTELTASLDDMFCNALLCYALFCTTNTIKLNSKIATFLSTHGEFIASGLFSDLLVELLKDHTNITMNYLERSSEIQEEDDPYYLEELIQDFEDDYPITPLPITDPDFNNDFLLLDNDFKERPPFYKNRLYFISQCTLGYDEHYSYEDFCRDHSDKVCIDLIVEKIRMETSDDL